MIGSQTFDCIYFILHLKGTEDDSTPSTPSAITEIGNVLVNVSCLLDV